MSHKNITLLILILMSFCLAIPCEAAKSKNRNDQSNSNIISTTENSKSSNKAETEILYTPDPAKDRVDISEIQNNLAPNAIADPKSKSSSNFQDRDSD